MVNRYRDQFPQFNFYNLMNSKGVMVCCPSCGGEATAKLENGACLIRCHHCYGVIRRSCQKNIYAAKGSCSACGRWMRVPLKLAGALASMRIACPYCGSMERVSVDCVGTDWVDPLADLTLYYQSSYRGQTIWALNRDHLNYLIDFIGAGLREKALCQDGRRELKAGQSQHLPKFLLQAKNRAGILKVLLKMRDK